MSALLLRILTGISPFLVAFLEDKFNIFFLTSLSVTFEKFNVLLKWKLTNFILCTLLWFLNVSILFTSSSRWLILFALRFMCLVIFVKYLFIIAAIFPSLSTISFSFTRKMLFEFKPLFENNGLTDFQKDFIIRYFFDI